MLIKILEQKKGVDGGLTYTILDSIPSVAGRTELTARRMNLSCYGRTAVGEYQRPLHLAPESVANSEVTYRVHSEPSSLAPSPIGGYLHRARCRESKNTAQVVLNSI